MPANQTTTLTGRTGAVQVGGTRVARVKQWAVDPKLATKSEWGDSDSAGYTNRTAGRMDAGITMEGVFDTENQQFNLFAPGDFATLALWLGGGPTAGNGSNNSAVPTNLYWYFPNALCTDFHLMVNIDTEEVIGWSSVWSPSGIFYQPGQAGAPTLSYPASL